MSSRAHVLFSTLFLSSPVIRFTIYMESSASGQDETKSRAMIGYPRGQDWAILSARDCPFCSHNNVSLNSNWVLESFLSQNILRDSKSNFCNFSVRMELETENQFCT